MTRTATTTYAIVPSWNGRALLERALPTLVGQSVPFTRVLVVDGGSTDGTRELLSAIPGVEAVLLERNRGFAAAANAGIRTALEDPAVEAVALVNNDVTLEPDWHAEAAPVLLSAPDVGYCATCLLRASRPEVVDSAGIGWTPEGAAETHLAGHPAPPARRPYEVWGASAAAALYRRELFETVGLFDESFFAYQEDVDLALRARRLGWRCLLAPAARGLHRGFASNRPFPLGGTRADFLNARNRIAVLVKSLPAADWRRLGGRILVAQLRLLAASFRERRAGAVLCGFLLGLSRVPRYLLERRRLSARMAVASPPDGRSLSQPERGPADP